jgi:hypothetical protein
MHRKRSDSSDTKALRPASSEAAAAPAAAGVADGNEVIAGMNESSCSDRQLRGRSGGCGDVSCNGGGSTSSDSGSSSRRSGAGVRSSCSRRRLAIHR